MMQPSAASSVSKAGRWPTRRPCALTLSLALLALASGVALLSGQYHLTPPHIAALVADRLRGTVGNDAAATVLFNIRLPRVLGAALVGAALSAAGAAYQVTFRNPLVSPDILGVSAGAGLGAVAGIFFGPPVAAIEGLSFAAGLGTVAVVTAVAAGMGGRGDTLALVLTGIAVGALAGAGIALLKVLADPDDQLPAMTFWLLGSLAGTKPGDVAMALPAIIAGLVPLYLLRWRIGLLAMGEDEARALRIATVPLRLGVIASATLMTAAAVAAAGTICWLGLMVPHMARLMTGARFDKVLPVSTILGASLMLLIDTAARSIASTEVPLGVLTAVVGAPLFLWLLARRIRRWS